MASQSKPKPLEELSDGDLSEIKKDPVWKTWFKEKGLGDIAAEVVAGGAKFGSKFTESLSEELSGKPSAKQPEAPQLDHPSEPITSTPTPATTVSAPKSPTKMKPTGATSGATPAPSKAAIKSWESWLEKRRSGKGRRRIKDPDEEEPEDTEWMPVNKRQGEKIGYTEEHEDIRTSRAAGQATPQAEQFERSRPQVKRIQEEPKVRRRTGTSEVPESKGENRKRC